MPYNKFFTREPDIHWSKVLCPFCSRPTGPDSKCEEHKPKGLEIGKNIINYQGRIMPLFALNCAFKQESVWEARMNYPVTAILLGRINQIKGVEKVYIHKTYTMEVSIGHLFNEKEVKNEINRCFKTFVKEMQSLENKLFQVKTLEETIPPSFVGVSLPNGQKFEFMPVGNSLDSRQSHIIESILDTIPGASGIKPNFKTDIL